MFFSLPPLFIVGSEIWPPAWYKKGEIIYKILLHLLHFLSYLIFFPFYCIYVCCIWIANLILYVSFEEAMVTLHQVSLCNVQSTIRCSAKSKKKAEHICTLLAYQWFLVIVSKGIFVHNSRKQKHLIRVKTLARASCGLCSEECEITGTLGRY